MPICPAMCSERNRFSRTLGARTGCGLVLLVLLTTACGKEGAPKAPLPRGPLPPRKVSARQLGDVIQVGITVPRTRGEKPGQQLAYAEMVRVTYPPGIDPPPDPDTFRRRGDVVARTPPGGELPSGEWVNLEDHTVSAMEDSGLGWTLRYAVRLRDAKNRSSMLAVAADLVPLAVVPAPRDLTGDPTAGGVRLNWSPPEDEGSFTYNVYRTRLGDLWPNQPLNTEPLAVTEYLDGDVKVGRRYAYTIRVVLAPGPPYREGEPCTPFEVVAVDRFPPLSPSGLVVVQEGSAVRLFWDPNPERDLAGYRVWRMVEGEDWVLMGPDLVERNSHLDEEPVPGKLLSYRVHSLDRADPPNESGYSEVVALELLEEPVEPSGLTP